MIENNNISELHLKTLEISNFKKFEHLKVENIGLINLVTGDNNVGKTSFVESLLLTDDMKQNIASLYHILYTRNHFFDYKYRHTNANEELNNNLKNNIVGMFQRNVEKPILIRKNEIGKIEITNEILNVQNTSNIEIKQFVENLKKFPGINILSKNWLTLYSEDKLKFMVDVTSSYYNDFFGYQIYFPIISLNDFFRDDLVGFYEQFSADIQSKANLISIINSVFTDIEILDIQPSSFHQHPHISIATKQRQSFHSLTQYGGGFVRVLRIILEILINRNRFLVIDEIDTGIHYLKMTKVWETIMKLANDFNVQIFATTHSSDCINSFVEAANKLEFIKNQLRLIELEEFASKEGHKIQKASTFDFENLFYKLETNTNVRGGNVWQ